MSPKNAWLCRNSDFVPQPSPPRDPPIHPQTAYVIPGGNVGIMGIIRNQVGGQMTYSLALDTGQTLISWHSRRCCIKTVGLGECNTMIILYKGPYRGTSRMKRIVLYWRILSSGLCGRQIIQEYPSLNPSNYFSHAGYSVALGEFNENPESQGKETRYLGGGHFLQRGRVGVWQTSGLTLYHKSLRVPVYAVV